MGSGRRVGDCLHCDRRGVPVPARGLCWTCLRRPEASAYPLSMASRRPWSAREASWAAYLRASRGLSCAEVARELGRTVDSVKRLFRRLRAKGGVT